MNKPISIAINETKNTMIEAINASGLPACILLEILNSLSSQINTIAKSELEKDTKDYVEALKAEQDNKEEEY